MNWWKAKLFKITLQSWVILYAPLALFNQATPSVETNVAPAKPLALTSGQWFGQIPLVKILYYLVWYLDKYLVFASKSGQLLNYLVKIPTVWQNNWTFFISVG